MKRIHLSRLLAVFLIVGLVIAPFSAPLNAATTASTATHSMATHSSAKHSMAMDSTAMDSMHMASMSDDMPCCPDKSAPMDCDQCPLMATCMVKTFQAASSVGVAEVPLGVFRMTRPGSDPKVESLAHLPPPKPPRSLVRSA